VPAVWQTLREVVDAKVLGAEVLGGDEYAHRLLCSKDCHRNTAWFTVSDARTRLLARQSRRMGPIIEAIARTLAFSTRPSANLTRVC
jgi:hypothetical protein